MTAGGFPHSEILGSKPCWRLPEAYRSLKRPSSVLSAKASTIRPCKQPARPIRERRETASPRQNKTPLATQIITQMITHKTIKHQTPKSPAKSTAEDTPQKGVPCSRPLSSSQTTTHPHASPPTPPGDGRPARGTEHQPRQTARGGGPGTQKHARTTPGRTARPARPKADSTLPHQQPPRTRHIRGKGAHTGHQTVA